MCEVVILSAVTGIVPIIVYVENILNSLSFSKQLQMTGIKQAKAISIKKSTVELYTGVDLDRWNVM